MQRMIIFSSKEKKAQEREQTKFVTNLLTESDFTIDKIANIAGVSVDFVKSVKQKLTEKK